ncbi:Uncharacterized protein HZ326_23351 [Fusarium oxysporum f. sp. albedinis]|nr:Uncharacterized protein HZ326_23351 [Fusarium oxysporum f. sp. albedinis]
MKAYIYKASKVLEVISSCETLFNILFRDLEDSGWFTRKSESKVAKVKFRNGAEEWRRDITGFLFAFISVYSEPQLAKIISGLPSADLAEIETYRQSKEGEMLKAGSEAASGHENKIRLCFEENLRRLDELSKIQIDAYIDDLTTVVTMSLPRKITATQWFDLSTKMCREAVFDDHFQRL